MEEQARLKEGSEAVRACSRAMCKSLSLPPPRTAPDSVFELPELVGRAGTTGPLRFPNRGACGLWARERMMEVRNPVRRKQQPRRRSIEFEGGEIQQGQHCFPLSELGVQTKTESLHLFVLKIERDRRILKN